MPISRVPHRRSLPVTTTVVLAVMAVTMLVGCRDGGSEDSSDPARRATTDEAADAPATGGDASGDAPGEATDGSARPGEVAPAAIRSAVRDVVQTARIEVRAPEPDAVARQASTAAATAGGYLFSQDAAFGEHGSVTAVYKVPPEQFERLLDELGGLGDTEARGVETQDVTGQVVDLDARVAAARTSAERVRALLADASGLPEVLELERELAAREADVEALEAQLADLEQRVELATITFVVRAPDAVAAGDDSVSFLGALARGWDAFVTAGSAVLVTVGYLAPFLALGGVVAATALVLVRRRRRSAPAT